MAKAMISECHCFCDTMVDVMSAELICKDFVLVTDLFLLNGHFPLSQFMLSFVS